MSTKAEIERAAREFAIKRVSELQETKPENVEADYKVSAVMKLHVNYAIDCFKAGYEHATRWIPVSERLPGLDQGQVWIIYKKPFFGTYIDAAASGYYDHPEHYEGYKEGTGWRFWSPDRLVETEVTHWQPITLPPNTGSGE